MSHRPRSGCRTSRNSTPAGRVSLPAPWRRCAATLSLKQTTKCPLWVIQRNEWNNRDLRWKNAQKRKNTKESGYAAGMCRGNRTMDVVTSSSFRYPKSGGGLEGGWDGGATGWLPICISKLPLCQLCNLVSGVELLVGSAGKPGGWTSKERRTTGNSFSFQGGHRHGREDSISRKTLKTLMLSSLLCPRSQSVATEASLDHPSQPLRAPCLVGLPSIFWGSWRVCQLTLVGWHGG